MLNNKVMDNLKWIQNIYSFIKEISDKDFQEKIWVKGLGPEVSSYAELRCSLYDDFNFELFLESHLKLNLPFNLYNDLLSLNSKLINYKEKGSDKEIIEDVKWLEIVECAKKVTLLFDEMFQKIEK